MISTTDSVARQTTFSEPARTVPVVREVDVIVCGGGPAGIGAALAAARTGARVQLIEVHGCLGGVWTAGLLTWIIDTHDKPGVLIDIMRRLEARGAGITANNEKTLLNSTPEYSSREYSKPQYAFGYDVEQMKLLLEEMCAEAGIEVRYYTRVAAAHVDDDKNLTTIITESKSGREAWRAKTFVDCTGEGDVAALAGCGFDYGDPETGRAQPMSLLGIIGGVDEKELAPFHRFHPKTPENSARTDKQALLAEMRRAGVEPSYAGPTLFKITDNLFTLMAHHEYSVCGMNADDLTRATQNGRSELHHIVAALKKLGGAWENLHLVSTAAQVGVREGRRIHGRYTVSTQDFTRGARHGDAVCRVNFGVDVHSTDPAAQGKGIAKHNYRVLPYDIPLRALIARDVNNLLLAGRCISGNFYAHASYRVTGNAVALGQGAGVAAALSVRHGVLAQALPWELIAQAQQKLSTN